MKTGFACRIKDQLQPKSPPRRIYNPLCCGLGSFGFNLNSADLVNSEPENNSSSNLSELGLFDFWILPRT